MLEARCPKCGYHCYGWALVKLEERTCPRCGSKLELIHEYKLQAERNQTNENRNLGQGTT